MKALIFAVLCLCAWTTRAAEPISIAAGESLKPYEELLTRIISRAGFELNFVTLPQARLIKELEAGRHDGGFLLSDFAIDEIPGMVRIPVSLGNGQQAAVAIRADIHVKTVADLARYRVGFERGNKSQEVLLPHLDKYYATNNSQSLFAMLAAGRLDLVIAPPARVPGYAREAGISQYYIQQPPVVSFPLYLALTARAASQEPRLTAVFRASANSGEWPREYAAVQARIAQSAGAAPVASAPGSAPR
ncbi:MAG: hypothetical protein RJA63_3017 [Pseudomonadota bacterium]